MSHNSWCSLFWRHSKAADATVKIWHEMEHYQQMQLDFTLLISNLCLPNTVNQNPIPNPLYSTAQWSVILIVTLKWSLRSNAALRSLSLLLLLFLPLPSGPHDRSARCVPSSVHNVIMMWAKWKDASMVGGQEKNSASVNGLVLLTFAIKKPWSDF